MSSGRPVPIARLRPRQRFQLPDGRRGQLLRLGPGSALVSYPQSQTRRFRTGDGRQVTIRSARRLHVSLSTMVLPGWTSPVPSSTAEASR